ncbi:hypothetical protein H9Q69_004338 [Fusarium xylarioides]|nr:hypothetical protein H9Q70_004013 [Fusarium xylarioides]KAG5782446.1 hypothetical protein H9Q73_003880 [Fusarium xylarioides]KAG5796588.1 hypothetical protein H9Q69_004338 [Fusarium xylarioides]KAG5821436.1 hypothetical protein H9Q71_000201 [Fusarium xylarioides]KAG5829658.1 hypothetical protein H9Q74_000306 [Fusarium xylarioides]
MSPQTFHPFPRLPTEIQLKIWKAACICSTMPRDIYDQQAFVHYVNVDTDKTGDRDQLTIRALDDQNCASNRSAYILDGGLWTACKQSREIITEQSFPSWVRLHKNGDYIGHPATLATRNAPDPQKYMVLPEQDLFCIRTEDWKSLPHHFEHCKTNLPSFDPLSSSVVPVENLAIEFDSSWIVDFPTTLEQLKGENSARGLVATWVEGVASGWVSTPTLFLIDKGTLLVKKTGPGHTIYHDSDGMYTQMYNGLYNDAIDQFMEDLWAFFPDEEYCELYAQNNPGSYDEDLHMWDTFHIDQVINVLVRFEFATCKEVNWTAVCNEIPDVDGEGPLQDIATSGRVYNLECDDDVGYSVGYLDGAYWNRTWAWKACDEDKLERVEYIKLF